MSGVEPDVDDAASSEYTESSHYESEHGGLQYWIADGALVGGYESRILSPLFHTRVMK